MNSYKKDETILFVELDSNIVIIRADRKNDYYFATIESALDVGGCNFLTCADVKFKDQFMVVENKSFNTASIYLSHNRFLDLRATNSVRVPSIPQKGIGFFYKKVGRETVVVFISESIIGLNSYQIFFGLDNSQPLKRITFSKSGNGDFLTFQSKSGDLCYDIVKKSLTLKHGFGKLKTTKFDFVDGSEFNYSVENDEVRFSS